VTANSTHNNELLRAMRGAGTVFGVVTELTLRLHDVSGMYGGYVVAIDDDKGSNFKQMPHPPPSSISPFAQDVWAGTPKTSSEDVCASRY